MSASPLTLDGPDRSPAPSLRCPSCRSAEPVVFHEQDAVPVHSCRLVDTREEALAFPVGTLRLAFCASCGFIANTAYDAGLQDYGIDYEETQGFSSRFRDFARTLARRWIERHDLREKDVLEIGCGKGEFLALLCEIGPNRGVGIDPAFVADRLESEAESRMQFITDVFSERYSDVPADAVVCRHTLEHIAPVADFLGLIRRTIGDREECVVLFDLPDVARVLRETAFWDVYYEHCSYFSAGSLARLFRRTGFRVVELEREYDDQYLVIEAFPGKDDGSRPLRLEERPEDLAEDVAEFGRRFAETTDRWRALLGGMRAEGRRAAIWGAGSKGVSFLTTLGIGDEVAFAIDINPYKRGKFLAGTGHRVVEPADLGVAPPDVVIAMNPVYLAEIRGELDSLGLGDTRVLTV